MAEDICKHLLFVYPYMVHGCTPYVSQYISGSSFLSVLDIVTTVVDLVRIVLLTLVSPLLTFLFHMFNLLQFVSTFQSRLLIILPLMLSSSYELFSHFSNSYAHPST